MSFWYIEDNTNNYSARNNTASGKKESFDQWEIRTERAERGVAGKSASTKQVAGIQGYPNAFGTMNIEGENTRRINAEH